MIKSFKELKELKPKKEGKVIELPNEQETLEVSTEPAEIRIEKEDKTSFEEFKVLYKGQIDDKCLEDYGTIEDAKLWEDTAKELFMASEDYIPEEDDKAEKIEESKLVENEEDPLKGKDVLYVFEDFDTGVDNKQVDLIKFANDNLNLGFIPENEGEFSAQQEDSIWSELQHLTGKEVERLIRLCYGDDIADKFEEFLDNSLETLDTSKIKYIEEKEIKQESYRVHWIVLDKKDNKVYKSKGRFMTPEEATKFANELKEIPVAKGGPIEEPEIRTESKSIKETLKRIASKSKVEEKIESGNSIFELKFDCSNEDVFGIGYELENSLSDVLYKVADKVKSGVLDSSILDINGNKIGSYGIGYEEIQSGLSESKKIEESVREDLIKIKEEGKGLYDYVANNYYRMSVEELKEIALDAIFVADKDNEIINEYIDRMEESIDTDIEKAKEDSKEKGLYCEGQEDSIYYVYSIYTMKDKNDTWMWKDSFESTGVSDKQEAEEKAKAKVKELKDSGEFYDVSYKEWEEDREEDKKYEIDISRYNTVDKIKARVKEINDELAYCRRRDRVCATFGGDQQVYDLKAEREKLKAKLAKLKKAKKTESSEDLPNITWILDNYDWDVDIVTKDQLGSDYYYRTLCTTVNDAERFNYHSDYWGDADTYQQDNIDLMEQVEPYVGKEVIVDYDEGSQKFKILGIVIDKQYNSLSHTCILGEELGEVKTEDYQLYYDDIQGMPTSERHDLWKQYHEEDFEDSEEGNNKFWDWAEEEFPVKELNEAVEEEINVTDADEDINSVMVIYISNQTFMKYYNLEKPLTIDELKNIRLKIKNHEMYVTDIADKVGAKEVNSKKELIPNTYIMKIKENDEDALEESKKVEESQVSDYTLQELNKVINDKGNDFKIQISGSEDKTNWLNIDKEDLEAICKALQSKKVK